MRKPLLAALALCAASAPSASAVHVDNLAGVSSCAARSTNGTRALCVFAATPGTYRLAISVDRTFGFGTAQVTCLPSGPNGAEAFVSAESPVTYASRTVEIPGGACALEVSSSAGVTTYGSVTPV